MEPHFRSTDGYAEHVGDLVVRVSLEVVQDYDFAQSCAQTREGSIDVDPRLRGERRCMQLLDWGRGHARGDVPRHFGVSQEDVHGDAMEPRAESRLAAKLTETLPGVDEHLLRAIVRQIVPDDASRQRVDARRVCDVEPLECLGIAPRGARHVARVRVGRDSRQLHN